MISNHKQNIQASTNLNTDSQKQASSWVQIDEKVGYLAAAN